MNLSFHWSDYLIFAMLLIFYSMIGVYHRFRSRIRPWMTNVLKRYPNSDAISTSESFDQNTEALILGNRKLTLLPVLSSVMASFLSAVSLMGTTSEVYFNGIQFMLIIGAYVIAFSLAAQLYTPVFYELRLTSAHEYLELRFNKLLRWITSVIFLIQMLIYISLALYAPALAFSQVTKLSLWVSILTTGAVGTFYTALGGIRAVVWTDVVQLLILTGGLLAIVIYGIVKVGGAHVIWDVAYDGLRLQSFDFSLDPFRKHTVWTLIIGGSGMVLSIYGTNQTQVQRYLACKDLKTARRSILLNIPLNALFLLVQISAGLISYVYFVNCDPYGAGQIKAADQILPYIVMVLFDGVPLIRGLFLSVIFAAALSTVSSGINSLSTVLLEDISRPLYILIRRQDIKQNSQKKLFIIFTTLIGILTIGIAFFFRAVGPRVLEFAFKLFGAVGGPILAVFTMGILMPFINWQGGLTGLICSLIVGLTLTIGSILHPTKPSPLPLSTANCSILNRTMYSANSTIRESEWTIFSLSYLYYTLACLIVAFITALPISAIFRFSTRKPVPENLLAWQARSVYQYAPECLRRQISVSRTDQKYRSVDEDGNYERRIHEKAHGFGEAIMIPERA